MADFPAFTYQTRVHCQQPENEVLDAYAELYGKVERTLFAATQAGNHATLADADFSLSYLLRPQFLDGADLTS